MVLTTGLVLDVYLPLPLHNSIGAALADASTVMSSNFFILIVWKLW